MDEGGDSRRRRGQWFGWYASCRSGQLRLNGSNGLTRRDLESQTRWNGHNHVPVWLSHGFVSQTQTQTEIYSKMRPKDGRNVELRLRDVVSSTSQFSLFYRFMLHCVFNAYFFPSLCLYASPFHNSCLHPLTLPKHFLWLIFSTFGD